MPRFWKKLRHPIAVLIGLFSLLVPTAVAGGGPVDRLPDLQMRRLSEFRLTAEPSGGEPDRLLLRFTAVIVNKGEGPFVVRAERDCSDSSCPTMTAEQRVKRSNGSWRGIASDGFAKYDVKDGHTHWHIMDVETYELIPMDVPPTQENVTGSKVGFCFFDTTAVSTSLPYSPDFPVFGESGCGVQSSTSIRMGLSVGWGDTYGWYLPRQWINVTDVPHGRYLVCATSDAFEQWTEKRDDNNQSWTQVELYDQDGSTAVRILGEGKSSCEEQLGLPAMAGASWRSSFPRAEAIHFPGPEAIVSRIEPAPLGG